MVQREEEGGREEDQDQCDQHGRIRAHWAHFDPRGAQKNWGGRGAQKIINWAHFDIPDCYVVKFNKKCYILSKGFWFKKIEK